MRHAYIKLFTLAIGALLTSQAWAFGGFNINDPAKDIGEPEECGIDESVISNYRETAPQIKIDRPKLNINQVLNFPSLQPVEQPNQPWYIYYNAMPNPKELKLMHSYSASKTDALKLAKSGKLKLHKVEYLDPISGKNAGALSKTTPVSNWGEDK
jgi:hypothetical protein